MESLIALIGTMSFMFFVLAASVEMILEMFRGVLELFGITFAKGKISLDESLKLAAEFAPNNNDLNSKIQAVKSAAEQIAEKTETKISELKKLESDLSATGADTNAIADSLNLIAVSVKNELKESERKRIFALRFLAVVVGSVLVWQSGFCVFTILTSYPDMSKYSGGASWIDIIAGGLAAAAGSSYWHDQLDKIRNLKTIAQDVKKLGI